MLGKKFILTVLQVFLLVCSVSLAEAAPAGPLAQIIEGAKKEGVVTLRINSDFGVKVQGRLRKEIKEVYGVDLKLEYTPSGAYSRVSTDVIGEYKAGFSTYDFVTNSGGNMKEMIDSGAVAKVDWLPLLRKGTPQGVIRFGGHYVALNTGHRVVIYNTKEVAANELPKRWRDLADPKWRGRFGITEYGSMWLLIPYLKGSSPESMLNDLRLVMKNKPMVGTYAELLNRYTVGEIVMAENSAQFAVLANQKGIPTAFASVEFSYQAVRGLAVLKLAKHPNAGRLVAAYLAGPEGFKLLTEEMTMGSLFYPGNYEHDISRRDQELGLPVLDEDDEKLMAYVTSPEYSALEKEVRRIIMTGK